MSRKTQHDSPGSLEDAFQSGAKASTCVSTSMTEEAATVVEQTVVAMTSNAARTRRTWTERDLIKARLGTSALRTLDRVLEKCIFFVRPTEGRFYRGIRANAYERSCLDYPKMRDMLVLRGENGVDTREVFGDMREWCDYRSPEGSDDLGEQDAIPEVLEHSELGDCLVGLDTQPGSSRVCAEYADVVRLSEYAATGGDVRQAHCEAYLARAKDAPRTDDVVSCITQSYKKKPYAGELLGREYPPWLSLPFSVEACESRSCPCRDMGT